MDYKKIFHDETAFSREYLQNRMEMYGFKNMSRMELFLWDLELFLQIQKRLGEHIVLKGGAATQFYLPIEAQRTSVDIDMIFCGTDEQVQNTLNDITKELGEGSEFFLFKEHMPITSIRRIAWLTKSSAIGTDGTNVPRTTGS